MLSGNARLHDASIVRIDSNAVLHLDFTGSDTVAALWVGGSAMPEGTYGSLTSPAANKSTAFAGTGVLRVGSAENYPSWASLHGVEGGPHGDDDQDGVENLMEYALIDHGERGLIEGNSITFIKRGEPYGSDLIYVLEISSTLAADSWSPAVTHGPAQLALPITYHFSPVPGVPRTFVRLRVEVAP